MKMQESFVREAIRKCIDEIGAASISVSIWDGEQEVSVAEGFGDRERGAAATPDSLYSVGSSTKAFTATALCILAAEGKLSLDDPVKKHLPEFRLYDDYATEHLTIRDMLSHRSGLPRYDGVGLGEEQVPPEETVRRLAYLKPAYPFRYRFGYQNYMFVLATLVLERVSGMSYEAFLKERILGPLGMEDTHVFGWKIPEEDPNLAAPYREEEGAFCRMERDWMKSIFGAGSLWSTTRDMLKWLRFGLSGNEEILPEALLRESQSPQTVVGADTPFTEEVTMEGYGLGWCTDSYRGFYLVSHTGSIPGYRSNQLMVPSRNIAVSVLSNTDCDQVVQGLPYLLLDHLLGLPEVDWIGRYKAIKAERDGEYAGNKAALLAQPPAEPAGPLSDYAGEYWEDGHGLYRLVEEDGTLYFKFHIGTVPLLPQGGDRFLILVDVVKLIIPINFKRDESGRVTGMEAMLEPALQGEMICFTRK